MLLYHYPETEGTGVAQDGLYGVGAAGEGYVCGSGFFSVELPRAHRSAVSITCRDDKFFELKLLSLHDPIYAFAG